MKDQYLGLAPLGGRNPSDNEVADLIRLVPEHKSANLVVDVQNTCVFPPSIINVNGPASGAIVGNPVDLLLCDTYTNVWVAMGPTSGVVGIQIQTLDFASGLVQSGSLSAVLASGNFTDPTSGLAQLPTNISSGGILWVNSGLWSLPQGGGASGAQNINLFGFTTNPVFGGQVPEGGAFPTSGNATVFGSGGGMAWAAFQRPTAQLGATVGGGRYARLVIASGIVAAPVMAGFMGNLRTTGSGGGFTYSPQLGSVVV